MKIDTVLNAHLHALVTGLRAEGILTRPVNPRRCQFIEARTVLQGDLHTNAALVCAPRSRLDLAALAAEMARRLAALPEIAEARPGTPGLVGVWLTPEIWRDCLVEMLETPPPPEGFAGALARETPPPEPPAVYLMRLRDVHNRCCATLEMADGREEGGPPPVTGVTELNLLKKLTLWRRAAETPLHPDIARTALQQGLAEIAAAFDGMWTNAPENATLRLISDEDAAGTRLRLCLARLTRQTMALGISAFTGAPPPQELR